VPWAAPQDTAFRAPAVKPFASFARRQALAVGWGESHLPRSSLAAVSEMSRAGGGRWAYRRLRECPARALLISWETRCGDAWCLALRRTLQQIRRRTLWAVQWEAGWGNRWSGADLETLRCSCDMEPNFWNRVITWSWIRVSAS
jgi:hypothetical protein